MSPAGGPGVRSAGAGDGSGAAALTPTALLAALRADAGSTVEGAEPGSVASAPDVTGLSPARAHAVLAAWTGARVHAGDPGLLRVSDPDLALLVGDWCYANALQALAREGDLQAIGLLAEAIGSCAVALTEAPVELNPAEAAWAQACEGMRAR